MKRAKLCEIGIARETKMITLELIIRVAKIPDMEPRIRSKIFKGKSPRHHKVRHLLIIIQVEIINDGIPHIGMSICDFFFLILHKEC